MNNEPVAWIYKRNDGVKFLNWKTWKDCETCNGEFIPLYTAPQGDGCGNCHACLVGVMKNNMPVTSQRMIVCSDCGNKRCPKASNHRHKCTGSNEVGQHGSIYTAPRELSDEEIKKCVIAWVKQIYGNEYVTPSDRHIINGTKLIRLAEKRIFKNDSL